MSVIIGREHGKATGQNDHKHKPLDLSQNPMIVYWEMTQACALACKHCRAEAMCSPQPNQLTHEESLDLLRQVKQFGDPLPHIIFTGGDPLQRQDLFKLIDEATAMGISVSITPSVTERLTLAMMQKLKAHGIQAMGISLDGSCKERHEGVRGIDGCFVRTMKAMDEAADLGFPIQVNTLVAEQTVDDLPAIYELLKTKRIMRWSLFFLIAVGRGKALHEMPAEQAEAMMEWVYDISKQSPFAIKTTEAPSYRRVALDLMKAEGKTAEEIRRTPLAHGFGIRDGNGVVFISNTGEICPAGFLPLSAGNIRNESLVDVYRNSELFRALHDPQTYHGKCGVCEYHNICGGSRARAFAHTGDPLASDPVCAYVPEVFRMAHANADFVPSLHVVV